MKLLRLNPAPLLSVVSEDDDETGVGTTGTLMGRGALTEVTEGALVEAAAAAAAAVICWWRSGLLAAAAAAAAAATAAADGAVGSRAAGMHDIV